MSMRLHFGLLTIATLAAAAAPASGASTLPIQLLRDKHPTFCSSPDSLPLVLVPPGEIKPMFHRPPEYTSDARRQKIEGIVRLEVCIAPEGEVIGVGVISGHPLLVPAAMQAARHWRFAPIRWNGGPARAVTEIDVPFCLKPEACGEKQQKNEI